jgi:glucans biosynthesis protein
VTRREFCIALMSAAFFAAAGKGFASPSALAGEDDPGAVPFSGEWLRAKARSLSKKPYMPPRDRLPAWVPVDWDDYQAIRFLPRKALWAGEDLPFQVRFFHLGIQYKRPVRINEVVKGFARPIPYGPGFFKFPRGLERRAGGEPPGFAGFRIHPEEDFDLDEVAFLGASYFRATGGQKQYGLSARGLAIDTGLPGPEEFPDFREFWLERPAADAKSLRVYALLDSPSTAGAYAFDIRTGERTIMEVEATLFPRRPIDRLGIAPMTSMFQHGENDRRHNDDFRPEVHDSDGLALWTGSGEWIWRPLVNPACLRVNSFLDDNPRGFGLLQRDRDFRSYQDDGARYHKRPSLWVEPLGPWGKGAVQLVEIPTDDEIFDNIVAYWNPAAAIEPGREAVFRYRLYWGADAPFRSGSAEVIATRLGKAGVLGKREVIPGRKFVIDFKGGRLPATGMEGGVVPVIWSSKGRIAIPEARPLRDLGAWRCSFDLVYAGKEPVDLRCYLADERGALTETWLYQWLPA